MSQEYQQYQMQLAMFRQEQRAREAEAAQRALQQQLAQGAGRTQQFFNTLATSGFARAGVAPDYTHGAGFFGPAYGMPGVGGTRLRSASSLSFSLAGDYLYQVSGGALGVRSGFSEAYSRDQSLAQQRSELTAVGRSAVNNFAAALTLGDYGSRYLPQSMSLFGFDMSPTFNRGNIGSLGRDIQSALSGLRGGLGTGIGGRGTDRLSAEQIAKDLSAGIFARDRGISSQQATRLIETASGVLTTDQVREMGSSGSSGVMDKMIRELQAIAKNTGSTYEQTAALVQRSSANGFGTAAVSRAAQRVRSATAALTTGANDYDITQAFMDESATGRMRGFDPESYAASRMSQRFRLIEQYQAGNISRDNLYQFGGINDFDAASRVAANTSGLNEQYVRSNPMLGLLGIQGYLGALDRGGYQALGADAAKRLAADPFSLLKAGVNQERIMNAEATADFSRYAEVSAVADHLGSQRRMSPEDRNAFMMRRLMDSGLDYRGAERVIQAGSAFDRTVSDTARTTGRSERDIRSQASGYLDRGITDIAGALMYGGMGISVAFSEEVRGLNSIREARQGSITSLLDTAKSQSKSKAYTIPTGIIGESFGIRIPDIEFDGPVDYAKGVRNFFTGNYGIAGATETMTPGELANKLNPNSIRRILADVGDKGIYGTSVSVLDATYANLEESDRRNLSHQQFKDMAYRGANLSGIINTQQERIALVTAFSASFSGKIANEALEVMKPDGSESRPFWIRTK